MSSSNVFKKVILATSIMAAIGCALPYYATTVKARPANTALYMYRGLTDDTVMLVLQKTLSQANFKRLQQSIEIAQGNSDKMTIRLLSIASHDVATTALKLRDAKKENDETKIDLYLRSAESKIDALGVLVSQIIYHHQGKSQENI